ncbi:hypothetical protein KY345_06395 [Candidatus Woesearchaeota archaeon]|nr:hypothetical protein [Candidatus Woesearchaeota archaeon]
MIFNQGYYHPLDRSYHAGDEFGESTGTQDLGIGVGDVGMSVPLGISAGNVQGVAVKMREGASNLEIAFPGAATGNRQSQTPGMYGKDTREALQELSKINEVRLTTHSAYNVMGLSGQDQQGNFSREYKKLATDEIKRAIEFAADTAGGGSVVVHTGEFERPISEEQWAEGGAKFRRYDEEPQDAIVRVVDRRTGQVMTQVRKNHRVAVAEWRRATEDNPDGIYQFDSDEKDKEIRGKPVEIKKGDYVDYEGNKIIDPLSVEHGRVPDYDPETGRFRVEMRSWDYFEKEAEEFNKLMNEQRRNAGLPDLRSDERMTPEERLMQANLETNEGYSRGWALQFSREIKELNERLEKLRKAREFYGKLWDVTPEADRWKLSQMVPGVPELRDLIPPDEKNPLQRIDEMIWHTTRSLTYAQESGYSQEKQARDTRETWENVVSARKYALEQAKKGYADAGIYAMDTTSKKGLSQPIYITMENIFPERYGAHPQELKRLVLDAREQMVKKLSADKIEDPTGVVYTTKEAKEVGQPFLAGKPKLIDNPYKRMTEEQARKAAEQHIKATIDTGHFNTWRKYFQSKPGETIDQTNERFKKWLVNQTDDLAKAGIIGNVHATDNFGYQDDHLAPGQGTTPVKDMLAAMKRHGYEGPITVEPGADATTDLSDFHGLMKTWREFGSGVYGAGYGGMGVAPHGPSRWGDIQYSYFGRNQPPYFVFGNYSPSNDWTLWTQVPME